MAGGRPVIDERVGLFALRSAAPAPKTGTVRKKRLGTRGILIRPEPSYLVLATRNFPHFAKVPLHSLRANLKRARRAWSETDAAVRRRLGRR
jgi:hypothetical protein